jgi:hypothetical protein
LAVFWCAPPARAGLQPVEQRGHRHGLAEQLAGQRVEVVEAALVAGRLQRGPARQSARATSVPSGEVSSSRPACGPPKSSKLAAPPVPRLCTSPATR